MGLYYRFGISGGLEEFLGTLACPLDPCAGVPSLSFSPCDERPLWVFRETYFLCLSLESCVCEIRRVPQPLIPSPGLGDSRKRIGSESRGEQESRETDWGLPLLLCSIPWRSLERTLK